MDLKRRLGHGVAICHLHGATLPESGSQLPELIAGPINYPMQIGQIELLAQLVEKTGAVWFHTRRDLCPAAGPLLGKLKQ